MKLSKALKDQFEHPHIPLCGPLRSEVTRRQAQLRRCQCWVNCEDLCPLNPELIRAVVDHCDDFVACHTIMKRAWNRRGVKWEQRTMFTVDDARRFILETIRNLEEIGD